MTRSLSTTHLFAIGCVLGAAALGCSKDVKPATDVVVAIDSDLGAELAAVDVEIRDASDSKAGGKHHFELGRSLALPLSFAVVPSGDRGATFVAIATGKNSAGVVIVQAKAKARFVSGKTLGPLVLWLGRACREVMCSQGQTCLAGNGVSVGACDAIPAPKLSDLDVGDDGLPGNGGSGSGGSTEPGGMDAGPPKSDSDADITDVPDADAPGIDAGSDADVGGSTAELCIGKAPGDRVCDGRRRGRCNADLAYEADDCANHQHCDSSDGVECVCDSGYEDDGEGGCRNIDDCDNVDCGMNAACEDGLDEYACGCKPGYAEDDDQACVDVDECSESNDCASSYPCQNLTPFYSCRGQFADWPMPDATPGAQTAPSYAMDIDTVTDDVTLLIWQRTPPATYPNCTGTIEVLGDTCSWTEADAYCKSAALATTLGGVGWRLPTKIELESIVDQTRTDPAINPVFSGTGLPSGDNSGFAFWTGSPVGATGKMFRVGFLVGQTSRADPSTVGRVRCVR